MCPGGIFPAGRGSDGADKARHRLDTPLLMVGAGPMRFGIRNDKELVAGSAASPLSWPALCRPSTTCATKRSDVQRFRGKIVDGPHKADQGSGEALPSPQIRPG